MNNFLVAVAVFLITALAALVGIPRVVNWDAYRGVIEEEATRLLARDVRVGGRVKVRLLPTPTFSVEQIRIADTEANSGEPFFRAEMLKGKLAIAPMFRGILQANEMVLLRPLLHLVLDGEGGGNWKTFGQGTGRMSFTPSDVALQAVRIEGGSLGIYGPDKSERLRLEAIDGELSAQALDGPFRFRGYFGADPARRELRLSTTKQEADGSIRFKASLKHQDTGSSYVFDARAVDLARSPRLEGELTAQVPLPQLSGPQVAALGQPGQPGASASGVKAEPEVPVEVKAALLADLKSVKLANLTLAFERFGRPQILTGEADIDLSQTLNMRAVLSAKWLDLDQLIGASPLPGTDSAAVASPPSQASSPSQARASQPGVGPIAGMLTLARRLNGFNPDQGRAALTLDVEQARLGREAVSGLRVVLQGQGAETDIQELRIGLPGGARADVKGLMTGSGDETAFAGDIVLRGSSLARFLAWSTGGAIALDPARDGPFAMRSKLSAAPGGVVAQEFVGELAGTVMQGELGYRWQGRPEISVLIEGPQVDLRPLLPDRTAGAGSLFSYLTAGAALGPQTRDLTKDLDAVLRVRAGQLLVPGGSYQDAAADIELRDGRVRVSQLRLVAANGVTLDVEGDVPTLATQPRGTLRGLVSASDSAGLAVLADLLALPRAVLPAPAQWSGLVPLRMAGTVSFGPAATSPLSVVADGDVAGTRVRLNARLEQGTEQWQLQPLDLSVQFDGAGAVPLARLLLPLGRVPDGPAPAAANRSEPPSRVSLSATGTIKTGLVTRATLLTGASKAEFNGSLALSTATASPASFDGLAASGQVRVMSPDARLVAILAPTLAPLRLDGNAIDGQADVSWGADGLTVNRIEGSLNGATVRGALKAVDDGSVTRVTGDLATNDLSIASVLRPLVVGRGSVSVQPTAAEPLGGSWPAAPFEWQALKSLTADVAVRADQMVLPGGVALRQVRFLLATAPGRLELRDLDGVGARGRWTGALKFDAVADGATATGVLRVQDAQLSELRADAATTPISTGTVSGLITLTSRALSPRDLMAQLAGRGTFTVSDTRLSVLTPGVVASALDAAMRGPAESLGPTLRTRLAAGPLPNQGVTVPARAVPFDVKNGIMTLSPVAVDGPDGRMAATLALELGNMIVNGTWRIELPPQALPPPPGWTTTINAAGGPNVAKPLPPLPPLSISFVAPLAALGQAKVEYGVDGIEREIAVRKLERDLEDLERLRKLDDERARDETERRRLLDSGAVQPNVLPADGQAPTGPVSNQIDAATQPTIVPDVVDPSLRPKTPLPGSAPTDAAAQKAPVYRPLSQEEQRRIFGGG